MPDRTFRIEVWFELVLTPEAVAQEAKDAPDGDGESQLSDDLDAIAMESLQLVEQSLTLEPGVTLGATGTVIVETTPRFDEHGEPTA